MATPGFTTAIQIRDEEILLKLTTTFEDSFVERKTSSDAQDWIKTAVGFANSAPVGYPAILFIGVRDDGAIEGGTNLDSLQKTLSHKFTAIYPPLYYWPKVLEQNGKQFLAVIVPGSDIRPHFAGPSYVRRGSQTMVASEEQFAELIAVRSEKSREILKWKNKPITMHKINPENVMHSLGRVGHTQAMFVKDCNQFYVTLAESELEGATHRSHALRSVDISFDHRERRLALDIRPT
jgi:hypothetical protein